MQYAEARAHLDTLIPYNLNDYNNGSLTAAGELALGSHIKDNVYIEIGREILELSRVSLDNTAEIRGSAIEDRMPIDSDAAKNLFVVRNLRHADTDAMTTIDDGRGEMGQLKSAEVGRLTLLGRKTLTIGTAADASPELRLDERSASANHMQIRLGNMSGNLHFAELGSHQGTVVYLTEELTHRIAPPRREFRKIGGKFVTMEAMRGRWSR